MNERHGSRATGLAFALLLAVALIAGCGAAPYRGSPSSSPVAASPAAFEPSITPVPTTDAPFPPTPSCPGPPVAPEIPAITATLGDAAPVAGLIGSFTVTTCSTSGSSDMAGGTPTPAIPAAPGDEILVTITEPWRIAQWSGWDVPAEGEGANTWGPTILAERPRSFTVGVPTRHGDSVLTLELLLVTDDGRAVATIPASFLVRVD